MFYVGIIGTDGAKNYQTFKERCIYYLRSRAKDGITIVSVEENDYISRFASEFRINVQLIPADWYTYGRDALKAQSQQLVKMCNGIISFEDGRKNTAVIKKFASESGVPVRSVKKSI